MTVEETIDKLMQLRLPHMVRISRIMSTRSAPS
jgi:hypothetical protein